MDWLRATAADLGRGIGAGAIDPVALTDAYLDAITAHPLRDRIYARLTRDRALAEATAAAARAKTGHRRGPLDGVPLSWKDLYDTAGVATEAGTALMAGRIPAKDAQVLQNATAAGTVCLGKTHMSEIAFSGLGYNPVTATPPNVNDPDGLPGGSSSGAAASVAFGLAPGAIGSDTGGSIRLPSGWNDLVGFKPAHGFHPLDGVVPLCETFDTVGPLCRSVEDAALINAVLGGSKPADLTGSSLRGSCILILDTIVTADLDPAPAAAFDHAVTRLSAAGARVVHGTVPELVRAYELALPLYGADAYAFWRPYVEAAPEKMYFHILERVRFGGTVLAVDFISAWAELRAIRQTYLAATAGYDAVICPTTAILPPKLKRVAEDADYYRAINLRTLRNTRFANLMGLTSISLPTGTPSCGIMLQSAPGTEGRLLRLAAAAEAALA
ncbi:MAG: amidase family protein [Rhodobacterales bacterium]|nr:amidase family protein [Rhodobacterales bacterium]